MKSTFRPSAVPVLLLVAALAIPSVSLLAFSPKEPLDNLDTLVFINPDFRLIEVLVDADKIRNSLSSISDIDSFLRSNGSAWRFTIDRRRGLPSLVGGGVISFFPGPANDLNWDDFQAGCYELACVRAANVEVLARDFLDRYKAIFMVHGDDLVLDPNGTLALGQSIYLLRFQWRHHGVPVEGASIFFRINNGNLIQVATEKIGPIDINTNPSLSRDQAWEILEAFLGVDTIKVDSYLDKGTLGILPMTPANQNTEFFEGDIGTGITYRLAYRFSFSRPGVIGGWEAQIDAHTGEILRFLDSNRYGRVHGGAYPGDNAVGEADRPFPFADTGLTAPNDYADSGGLFPGENATTTLTGKYTWITDYCGSIDNTTTTGDVDFSLGAGTDCDVPSPNLGGPGNTHSARTQYWHLTTINIKARSYLPSNTWLNDDHMNANTNQSPWCNATSGGGTLNFYQADTGCWNLGELPGVSLHEWGHSMDDFDGSGGSSPPVETRADWTAILQTHDACVGRGFKTSGECGGYGDPCLDCTGVRDGNYHQHQNATPWTAANHGSFWSCSGGSYFGPCGLEDHCESGISTQALWEFVNTDLLAPPTNLDVTSAWMLADRIFYTSMATLGNMYNCTPPNSDGCNGSSLYSTMMAIDDDGDGTANGTPHAAAIYAALARNNIACGAVGDPENQNQTSCPTLVAPSLSVTAGSDSATLSWDSVANATRYLVFRNEIGCDAGFTKIAEVTSPTTSHTDNTVVNGIEYYYRMQAATVSDACVSSMSACAIVTPQPCAGSIQLDSTSYNCSDTIGISLVDSDLTGNGSQLVSVWSDSETTPENILLTETPAGSGKYSGSIGTTSSTTSGDSSVGVVDGDTITVRYHDASYCGPAQDVDITTTTDCVAPVISGVQALNVTGFSAEIAWLTDEGADSLVVYDNTVPPMASNASDSAFVTSHSLTIIGLDECTSYAYSVTSGDPAANASTDNNGGAFFTFLTGKNTQPTYAATDVPVAISDNTIVTSLITVADDKAILDLNVSLDITHTFDGDLEISLLGPNGAEIMLVNNRGSSGNDFTNTIFDDEATTPITSGTPPFTGSFQPEEPLSTFDSLLAAGDWTLKVNDTAGGDQGTIDGWSLTLLYAGEACPSSEGWIDLDESTYGCSASIEITVQDVDLAGSPSLDIEVWSDTETTPEIVNLGEAPASSGVFVGVFATTGDSAANGDAHLSITTGDTITARYIDADDGQSGANLVRTDIATADCAGPVISNVVFSGVTGSRATITWDTTEVSDSRVTFENTTPPSSGQEYDAAMVNTHSIELMGLTECTRYYFFVESTDTHSNTAFDNNGGANFTFVTGMSSGESLSSTDTPIDIPDSTPAGITSVIAVTDDKLVVDVNVIVNITHTFDGDLDITLIGPTGTRVELTSDNGSSGENFIDTVFDDEATTPVTSGTAPFTGSYQPEQPLAALDAINANGNWSLEVIDDAGIDTGTLNSWTLTLTYEAEECTSIPLFSDGFESGDTSAWTVLFP